MTEPKTVGEGIKEILPALITPAGAVDLAAKKLFQEGGDAVEADDPTKTKIVDRVGGGTAAQGGEFAIGTAPPVPEEDKIKAPGSIVTLTGTQVAGLSDANKAVAAETQRRLEEASYLQGATQLQALSAGEREQGNLAFVNEHASDLISDLRTNHFPQARAKIQQLQKDVDDARAMKVNPYNWHDSIGRGGRVAAAFSLLTGQLAAGAGNPNTALQMMDAAIARDIAAQDQNIKSQFEGIKLQKGLLQDERELLTEELAAINTNRAVKYAAIVARIQYAEQHAITETARLTLITMKDHYNVRLLQSIAAANAQYMTLHVKGPLRSRTEEADLRRIMKLKAVLQEQLDASTAGQQALQAGQTPISLSTGETAADLGFQGGPGAPQERQALPADQGQAAAVASRRPSKAGRPSGAGTLAADAPAEQPAPSTDQERIAPDRTGETLAEQATRERQDAATGVARTLEEAKAKVAAGGTVSPSEMSAILKAHPDQGGAGIKSPGVVKARGYAMRIAEVAKAPLDKVTTIDAAVNAVSAKQPIPNKGMQDQRDADLVSSMIAEPRRSVFAAGKDGQALYDLTLDNWRHGQDFPEIYEAPGSIAGQRNNIKAGNRNYRLLRSSAARTNPSEYKKLADDMAEMSEGIELMERLADELMRVGPSGLFDEGGFTLPGITSTDPTKFIITREAILGAMQFIKQNDPTARISDQDIKLGDKAMGDILSGKFKFIDFVQSFAGTGATDNTIRKSLRNYFQELAIQARASYWKKHQNDLIPSAETLRVLEEDTKRRQKFVATSNEVE